MKVCFGDLPKGSRFYSGLASVDTEFTKLSKTVDGGPHRWNAVNCKGGNFVWFEPTEQVTPSQLTANCGLPQNADTCVTKY